MTHRIACCLGLLALGAGPDVPELADVAAAVGIDFRHYPGAVGEFYPTEIMGPGCALVDIDNDGDLDAYLLQGALHDPAQDYAASTFPPQVELPPRNRLYRNELISQGRDTGVLRFTDVTAASGAGHTGYGMGVATGDYDNDGDTDLYVTNFGPDALLANNGDGTFTDVTESAGLGDPRWTSSAAFFDYDRDGFLDLVVAAYHDFALAINSTCLSPAGGRDYCGPTSYKPIPDRLYRNRGDGTFEDVTGRVGMDTAYGHGLGVATIDVDGNGWIDVYIANDGDENQLWMNEGGRFTNAGLMSGAVRNQAGKAEAGMGIAVGDFDDDGDADFLVTHLRAESNTFYVNLGRGFFMDGTARAGLGQPSRPFTGFGVAAVDVDHDADLDVLVANGAVYAIDSLAGDPFPYHERNQLYLRDAGGGYADRSADAGPAMALSEVSRGLAAGDVDNDGDVDFLIANTNGPARLLRNELSDRGGWLLLRVIDDETGRDAVGATVRVLLSDGRALTRYVTTAGSYCSAGDPRVHFAWPAGLSVESVRVTLPDGRVAAAEPAPRTISTVHVGGASTGRGQ